MTDKQPKHILLVEDEPALRRSIRLALHQEGYQVTCTGNGAEGLKFLIEAQPATGALPDLLITDLQMPVMNGRELLTELQRQGIVLPTLVITGFTDPKLTDGLDRFPWITCLEKPLDPLTFLTAVHDILESPRMTSSAKG